MNRQNGSDPRFHTWLAVRAPRSAPDGLLQRAMQEVDGMSQERGVIRWPMLRFTTQMAALAAVVVLAVVAGLVLSSLGPSFGGPGPGPTHSVEATPTPASSLTPAASGTPAPSHSADPSAGGGERRVTVSALLGEQDPVAAYGGDDLTIEAVLGQIGMVDGPGGLEPQWLAIQNSVLLGEPGGPYLDTGTAVWAVLHPDVVAPEGWLEMDTIGTLRLAKTGLATITAHFDDLEASSCRYEDYSGFGPEPSPDEVVATCRSTLVITEIE